MKEVITESVKILEKGGVILYPSDTIWGIGCDATNEKSIKKIVKYNCILWNLDTNINSQ